MNSQFQIQKLAVSETIEQAEVLLSNLHELGKPREDNFLVDHLDVLVTLKTAIRLLQEAQQKLL